MSNEFLAWYAFAGMTMFIMGTYSISKDRFAKKQKPLRARDVLFIFALCMVGWPAVLAAAIWQVMNHEDRPPNP